MLCTANFLVSYVCRRYVALIWARLSLFLGRVGGVGRLKVEGDDTLKGSVPGDTPHNGLCEKAPTKGAPFSGRFRHVEGLLPRRVS